MGEQTNISWCNHSCNFWWGCTKISSGCQHCYAETLSKRYGKNIWGPAATTDRMRTKGPWKDILKWDKVAKRDGVRRQVFVQSMSDFFEDHPQLVEWRREACEIIEQLEWLDIQLLTKRPENILNMVPVAWRQAWPEHIWIGASVENQDATERLGHLLMVPARIHFVSVEPMLSEVNMFRWLGNREDMHPENGVNWVICGGESGPHARPMQLDWARSLRDQCQASGVAYFFKQVGGYPNKRESLEDIPEDLRIREFPVCEREVV